MLRRVMLKSRQQKEAVNSLLNVWASTRQCARKKRSTKCKQAKRCMESICALIESKENVNSVNSELFKFIKYYQDANDMHESFVKLPLPQYEVTRQSKYFEPKMTMYCDFPEKVKCWLSETGHPYLQPNKNCPNDQSVADENKPWR